MLLCALQLVLAACVLYLTVKNRDLHDQFNELFAEAVASLCGFAACAGLVGVVAASRPMLLLLYINQLWALSCLSTLGVLQMTSSQQGAAGGVVLSGATAASPPLLEVDVGPLIRVVGRRASVRGGRFPLQGIGSGPSKWSRPLSWRRNEHVTRLDSCNDGYAADVQSD